MHIIDIKQLVNGLADIYQQCVIEAYRSSLNEKTIESLSHRQSLNFESNGHPLVDLPLFNEKDLITIFNDAQSRFLSNHPFYYRVLKTSWFFNIKFVEDSLDGLQKELLIIMGLSDSKPIGLSSSLHHKNDGISRQKFNEWVNPTSQPHITQSLITFWQEDNAQWRNSLPAIYANLYQFQKRLLASIKQFLETQTTPRYNQEVITRIFDTISRELDDYLQISMQEIMCDALFKSQDVPTDKYWDTLKDHLNIGQFVYKKNLPNRILPALLKASVEEGLSLNDLKSCFANSRIFATLAEDQDLDMDWSILKLIRSVATSKDFPKFWEYTTAFSEGYELKEDRLSSKDSEGEWKNNISNIKSGLNAHLKATNLDGISKKEQLALFLMRLIAHDKHKDEKYTVLTESLMAALQETPTISPVISQETRESVLNWTAVLKEFINDKRVLPHFFSLPACFTDSVETSITTISDVITSASGVLDDSNITYQRLLSRPIPIAESSLPSVTRSSQAVENLTKFDASIVKAVNDYSHQERHSPKIQENHTLNNIDSLLKQSPKTLEERIATLKSMIPPAESETIFDKLYRDMLDQEIRYDDEYHVSSFFTNQGDKEIYVRDARRLGSAELVTSDSIDRYNNDKDPLLSRQWLIMGINYTLALSTLLDIHEKLTHDAQLRIRAMVDKFIALADKDTVKKDLTQKYKEHFRSYVNEVLAPELHAHLPVMCSKDGCLDQAKAVKLLDNAKDWTAMHRPSPHIVTISQLEGKSNVGEGLSEGALLQYENPVCQLTEGQSKQWDNYEDDLWYERLSKSDKKICAYFSKQLKNGDRVIPAQLRDRVGIGGKNTYHSETLLFNKGDIQKVLQHGHSGGLPLLVDGAEYRDAKSKAYPISSFGFLRKAWDNLGFSWLRTIWNPGSTAARDRYWALREKMEDTAKSNLEQRSMIAQKQMLSSDIRDQPVTLSIILNSEKMALWFLHNATDLHITRSSRAAVAAVNKSDNQRALFFRSGVALGSLERTNITEPQAIITKTESIIEQIKKYNATAPVEPISIDHLSKALEQFKRLMPADQLFSWMSNYRFTSGEGQGINLAGKLMVLCHVRNELKAALQENTNKTLKKIGKSIEEIYVNVSCASGDNRTQLGSVKAQASAATLAMDGRLSEDQITSLMVMNRHSHLMSGSWGGSFGTAGVRQQSLGSYAEESASQSLSTANNHSKEITGLTKKIWSTDESDLKSAKRDEHPDRKLDEKRKKVFNQDKIFGSFFRIVQRLFIFWVILDVIPFLRYFSGGYRSDLEKYNQRMRESANIVEQINAAANAKAKADKPTMPSTETGSPLHTDPELTVTTPSSTVAPVPTFKKINEEQVADSPEVIKSIHNNNHLVIGLQHTKPDTVTTFTPTSTNDEVSEPVTGETSTVFRQYVVHDVDRAASSGLRITSTKSESSQTEAIKVISTSDQNDSDLAVKIAQSSVKTNKQKGYVIAGDNFFIKLRIALGAISKGIDVTQPEALISWPTLKQDFSRLHPSVQNRVMNTLKSSKESALITALKSQCVISGSTSMPIGENRSTFFFKGRDSTNSHPDLSLLPAISVHG